jgi:hypothetical protein
MRVYVLLENRLNDDQMVGIRTGGFPTDAARLRKLCDVENVYLADANSTAITYHDFVLGNNMGYTIGNIPLVIFGGHASIEDELSNKRAITLTSQNGQHLNVQVISEGERKDLAQATKRWLGAPIVAAKRAASQPTFTEQAKAFTSDTGKIQDTVVRASKKFTYVVINSDRTLPNDISLNVGATDTHNLYTNLIARPGWR